MPRPRRTRAAAGKSVEALRHEQDTRTNIPTAEYQSLLKEEQESPLQAAYQRRNRDLDPQLVWRGKDEQDLDDLVVNVPPLYIQEKVHPKALIADLLRQTKENRGAQEHQIDMFADFNGLPEGADRTEFYQHDGYWQNRMILGDSLQVMASLSEREGSRARCSASTSTLPTAYGSTPTSSGPPPAGTSATATATTSPGSRSRSKLFGIRGGTASTPT